MEKVRVVIRDLDSTEVENILDENGMVDYEWIYGCNEDGNQYILSYEDDENLGDVLELLYNAGADVEEI